MQLFPALLAAIIIGGLTLFGLLWLWFYFEQGGSGSYGDQSGYSQNGYNNGYDGNSGYGGGGGYGNNGYGSGYQPVYPYVRRARMRPPCYNPCY